jgi:hypothetical protein
MFKHGDHKDKKGTKVHKGEERGQRTEFLRNEPIPDLRFLRFLLFKAGNYQTNPFLKALNE